MFFTIVLAVIAVASTWLGPCAIASAALVLYVLPALFGWRVLADAAFGRYSVSPERADRARKALPWAIVVLAGVALSLVIGASRGC
jgi:hypothetical protein